jgi:hypothetical protein
MPVNVARSKKIICERVSEEVISSESSDILQDCVPVLREEY